MQQIKCHDVQYLIIQLAKASWLSVKELMMLAILATPSTTPTGEKVGASKYLETGNGTSLVESLVIVLQA